MNKLMKVVILLLFCSGMVKVSAEEPKKIRILGVGNSFTKNATRFLGNICKSDPTVNAEIALAYIGGSPMDLHDKLGKLAEANPEDPKARRYKLIPNDKGKKGKYTLIELLKKEKWDYVTIQQVSYKSYKPETYSPHAENLQKLIKKYAPQAKLVIHETWAHRYDCPRVKQWNLPPKEMYEKLHDAYGRIARKLKAPIIPVGTAFEESKKHELWNYQNPEGFDPKKMVHPAPIPDQSKSLHNGWRWHTGSKSGKKRVSIDGYHANVSGEYLGSLIWYEFFFGKDARKVSYIPRWLNKEQAKSLQEIAHNTMAQKDWHSIKE